MFRIKDIINYNSVGIYDEAYKKFDEICEENILSLENSESLLNYFRRNWHKFQSNLVCQVKTNLIKISIFIREKPSGASVSKRKRK
jgi:hypothetical protein